MPGGCLSIRVHHKIVSARIKLRVVVLAGDIRRREWLSTGIVLPRIIKTTNRKSKRDAGSPGRGPVAGVKGTRYQVVTHGVRTANRRAAVSARIPGETQVRRQISPSIFHAFPLADSRVAATGTRKTRISRVGQTERRIVKHRARLAGQGAFHAEIRNGAIPNHLRETWLPTHTIIDGQARRRPPR